MALPYFQARRLETDTLMGCEFLSGTRLVTAMGLAARLAQENRKQCFLKHDIIMKETSRTHSMRSVMLSR
jgi:hypothetical protein